MSKSYHNLTNVPLLLLAIAVAGALTLWGIWDFSIHLQDLLWVGVIALLAFGPMVVTSVRMLTRLRAAAVHSSDRR